MRRCFCLALVLFGCVAACEQQTVDDEIPTPDSKDVSATVPAPADERAEKEKPTTSDVTARGDDDNAKVDAPSATPGPLAGTPPDELHEVKKGLWRGAHPNRAGLEHVKSLGVKTILSLQQPDGSKIEGDVAEEVAQEQVDAKALGLEYISVPMSSWSDAATYDAAWTKVKPVLAKDGVYVHCQHGHDRTGLVIALERVFIEKKSPDEAHQEWKDLGHTSLLFRMDSYFDEKTDP